MNWNDVRGWREVIAGSAATAAVVGSSCALGGLVFLLAAHQWVNDDWVPPESSHPAVMLQRTDRDCGVAAVGSLLRVLGVGRAYEDLVDQIDVEERGVDMLALSALTESNQVTTTGYRFKSLDTVLARFPSVPWIGLLGSKRQGHYVVVWRVAGDTVTVLDPTVGRRLMRRKSFESRWTGYALVPG